MEPNKVNEIKSITEDLLQKMTIDGFGIEASLEENNNIQDIEKKVILLNIKLREPQFLIGQEGKNLIDLQKVLRLVLNKKLNNNFYLKLDINDYQKQKTEHLKDMAKKIADEVVLYKKEKTLPPMSSFNRRIIHEELSKRQDVVTQSKGEGDNRYIVIMSK